MASIFKILSILLLVLHVCTILGSPIETYPNSSNTDDTDTNAITPWKKVKLPPIFKKSAFLGRILKRKRIIPVTSNETAVSSSSNVTSSSTATQIVRPQRHVLFPGDHHHEEDHHEETFSQGLLNITNALMKPWVKYNSRLSKTAGTLPELFAAKGKLVGTVIATPIHLATYTLNRLANRITKTMNQNSIFDSNPENTDSSPPAIDPRNANPNPNAAAEELINTLESIRKAYDARLSELNVKIRENVPVLEKPFEQVHGSVSGVLAETIREFGKSLHHLGAHMKRTGKSVSNLATKFKAFNTNPVEREPKVPNATESVVAVTPKSNETNVESRIETPDDSEAVVVGDGFQLEPRNSSVSIDSQGSNLTNTTQTSIGTNETVVLETSTLVTSDAVETTTPLISNIVESTTNESNTVSSVESIADSVETTSPVVEPLETSTVVVILLDGTTVSPIRSMNESAIESFETTVSSVQLLNQSIETTLLSVIESQETSTVAVTVLDGTTTVSPVHSIHDSSLESRESFNVSTTTFTPVQLENQSFETTLPVIESQESSTVAVLDGTTVSPVQLENQSVETVTTDVSSLETSTLESADIQEESIVPNETLTTVSSFVGQSVETTAFVVESLENSTTVSTVQFLNQSVVVEVSNPIVDSSLEASTVDATATVLPDLNKSVETTASLVESLETSTTVSIVQLENQSVEATLTQSVDSLETFTVDESTVTVSIAQPTNQSEETTILDSTTVSPVQLMNESTIESLETTVSTVQLSNHSTETRTSPVTESPETATPHIVTTVSPNVHMFNESVESTTLSMIDTSTIVSTAQLTNQSFESTTLDGSTVSTVTTVSPVQSMNESAIESLQTTVSTVQILNQSVETISPVVESFETSSVDATSSVSPVQSMNRSVETQTADPLETFTLENSDIQEESIVLNETLTTVSPLMIDQSVETTTSLWIGFVEPSTVEVALDGTTVSPVRSMNESTIESRKDVQSTTVSIDSVETIPSLVVDNSFETSVSIDPPTLNQSTVETESRSNLIETTPTLNESTQFNDSTTPVSVDIVSETVSTVFNQSTVSSVDALEVSVDKATVMSIEKESVALNETTSITVSTVGQVLLNRSDEASTEIPIETQTNDSLSITTQVSTVTQESVNATEVPQVFTTVSTVELLKQSNEITTETTIESQLNTTSLTTVESIEASTIVSINVEPLNETVTNSSTTESSTLTVSIESSTLNASAASEPTQVAETITSEQSNLSYIDQGLISAVETTSKVVNLNESQVVETTTLASLESQELNRSVETSFEANETLNTVVDDAVSTQLNQVVETSTQIETEHPTTVSTNKSTAQPANASESTEQHHLELVLSPSQSPIPTTTTEMYFQKSEVLPRASEFETNNFQLKSPIVNQTNNNSDCKFATFINKTRKV